MYAVKESGGFNAPQIKKKVVYTVKAHNLLFLPSGDVVLDL